mmetsp:Transcript_41751/g.68518  ORF Transcript_41751/g.68518 Transcript_41751/m.68518 type:complete len:188 (-) Transcript_41751:290-853(-)
MELISFVQMITRQVKRILERLFITDARGKKLNSGIHVDDLPVYMSSPVVKGFGRGSKLLGIPTANMDRSHVANEVDKLPAGIYFGWAKLNGLYYKSAISVGWNPCFDDVKEKTVEPHLIHEFKDDFYGQTLELLLTGYIRPEQKFDSMDSLIEAIKDDIQKSSEALETEKQKKYQDQTYWQTRAVES